MLSCYCMEVLEVCDFSLYWLYCFDSLTKTFLIIKNHFVLVVYASQNFLGCMELCKNKNPPPPQKKARIPYTFVPSCMCSVVGLFNKPLYSFRWKLVNVQNIYIFIQGLLANLHLELPLVPKHYDLSLIAHYCSSFSPSLGENTYQGEKCFWL